MPASERDGAERDTAAGPGQRRDDGAPPAVDVQAIADRVYRLMLAEARLDRVRGAATRNSSARG